MKNNRSKFGPLEVIDPGHEDVVWLWSFLELSQFLGILFGIPFFWVFFPFSLRKKSPPSFFVFLFPNPNSCCFSSFFIVNYRNFGVKKRTLLAVLDLKSKFRFAKNRKFWVFLAKRKGASILELLEFLAASSSIETCSWTVCIQ